MAEPVTRTITVNAPVSEAYELWEDFENFPRFMKHIKSVTKTAPRSSHWVMSGPLGKELQWDAITVEVDRNYGIAWQSTEGDVENSGRVTFRSLGPGLTEITVTMYWAAPGHKFAEAVADFFQVPQKRLEEDLENFRKYAQSRPRVSAGTST
jgi:uncharacterized membrane protein